MKKLICTAIISVFATACSSTPEVPKAYNKFERQPQSEITQKKKVPLKEWKRYLVSTEIRAPETDCQVYNQPNLYSEKIDTAKAGKEVWTEDTGSAWYKVYKNQKYGYASKICFTN